MTREEFLQSYPDLIKDYNPSPTVASRIRDITLLMTIGPSGVGKTTIMKRLGVSFVPSDVTRPKRPEEIDGVDYNFRTDYDKVFEQIKAGEFVQVAIGPGSDFYATIAGSYPRDGIATMAVVADVIPIFRELGFKKTTSAFIVPPSYEEWIRRMERLHTAGDQLAGRLAEAKRSFKFALSDSKTRFILNDDIDKAVEQIKNLLDDKIDDQTEQQAREAAQQILDAIE